MKTNKSYTKRIRVTKTGKILVRKPGGNHFNAKESRRKQLARRTPLKMKIKSKARNRFVKINK